MEHCVGHFLDFAEAQSVHQMCMIDSTPFHKNAVQPPTEAHMHAHTNHKGGAPVLWDQSVLLYEAVDPMTRPSLCLFLPRVPPGLCAL